MGCRNPPLYLFEHKSLRLHKEYTKAHQRILRKLEIVKDHFRERTRPWCFIDKSTLPGYPHNLSKKHKKISWQYCDIDICDDDYGDDEYTDEDDDEYDEDDDEYNDEDDED